VDQLLVAGIPVIFICSSAGRIVWDEELEEPLNDVLAKWKDFPHFTSYNHRDLKAPIASGTYPVAGMAIVPCSMNTLAAISHGLSDNLIRRAADVTLKEQRKLVLVTRETPLSAIHLDNMVKLAHLGVTVLPPEPPFYLHPKTIDDVVEFIAARVLVALRVVDEVPAQFRYKKGNLDL
jgi:4-hydroxy-3-polyprenylbenzoate decarboxylase